MLPSSITIRFFSISKRSNHCIGGVIQHLFRKQYKPLCSSAIQKKEEEFTVLYRWPTMKHFRFISRFKLYQVSAMVISLGPLSHWYSKGLMTYNQLLAAYGASFGMTVVLCGLSYVFSKVLGELAVSFKTNTVRISTLSFLGGRKITSIPTDHVVPFDDSKQPNASFMQVVETTSPPLHLYYSTRYGVVHNSQLLCNVLGIHVTPK